MYRKTLIHLSGMMKCITFSYLLTLYLIEQEFFKNDTNTPKVILCEGIYLLFCLTNQVIKMYPRSCILFTICINTSTKQVSQHIVTNFFAARTKAILALFGMFERNSIVLVEFGKTQQLLDQ